MEALEGRRHTVPCDSACLHSLDTRAVQPHFVAFYRGTGRRVIRASSSYACGLGKRLRVREVFSKLSLVFEVLVEGHNVR